MLWLLVRRRWPVLTTMVGALVYIANNYDVRGLSDLRLEPKAPAAAPLAGDPSAWPSAYGVGLQPLAMPMSVPPGMPSTMTPTVPSTVPSTMSGLPAYESPFYPSASTPAMPAGTPVPAITPAHSGSGRLASSLPLPGGSGALGSLPGSVRSGSSSLGELGAQLSLGEKLAMLDQARGASASRLASTEGLVGPVNGDLQGRSHDGIKIASFNLDGWSESKRSDVANVRLLTRILAQFDLIALQDIRSRQDDMLPELISQLNASGRKYDFMIGPRVGRGQHREQLGFVFDTDRIETDRFQLYTVDDPEDMLSREPLVGWFRTVCAAREDAFTFSLVNVHIDPDLASNELRALPSLVQAIVNDGRGEDDVILAGDFSASANQLESLLSIGMRVALDGVATTTRGTQMTDNIAMPESSTQEYNGRSGALDFLRHFNLSLEQAVSVSEHLPIWAEFSALEGGRPGQVAGRIPSDLRLQNGVN